MVACPRHTKARSSFLDAPQEGNGDRSNNKLPTDAVEDNPLMLLREGLPCTKALPSPNLRTSVRFDG